MECPPPSTSVALGLDTLAISSASASPASTSPPTVFSNTSRPSIRGSSCTAASWGITCSYLVVFCPCGASVCPSTWPMTVRQWMAWPPRVRVTVPSSSMRSFSSRCWSTEVVCVSGILCSPFALFCIIMPRPTGGYPSAAGSYHLIFCNFFVFFRLVFDIRLPCSILYNDMELTIRGAVPTALHTPAFFRAGQTRRFFA